MISWLPEKPLPTPEETRAALSPFDAYRNTLLYAAQAVGGEGCERTVRAMVYEDGHTTEDAIEYLLKTYGDTDVMMHVRAAYDRFNDPNYNLPQHKRVARRIGSSALAVIRHTRKLLQQTT